MASARFVPLSTHTVVPPEEMQRRAREFNSEIQRRRTVRAFDSRPVPREVIEDCLRAAGSAPSGAHMQPWYFVAVADPSLKSRIRLAAEIEERDFYERRAPAEWLAALEPLGTDDRKPFLELAPWLIVVFLKRFCRLPDGRKVKNYYTDESVGIATGFLLAALHHSGLASLTHTPSPMGFLSDILGRPKDTERPFMIVVTGYPQPGVLVPDLRRKNLEEIATFL
ncbi:MAG: nitroreductase family protein [Steroidobacteraceae bacterium]